VEDLPVLVDRAALEVVAVDERVRRVAARDHAGVPHVVRPDDAGAPVARADAEAGVEPAGMEDEVVGAEERPLEAVASASSKPRFIFRA
jgi:hypothetical protein